RCVHLGRRAGTSARFGEICEGTPHSSFLREPGKPITIPAMAQGLYLSQKMSLQQVLAPQLQQSLALLQAPTLELKALVEQELQQNPVLEEVPLEDVEIKDRTPERDGEPTPAETAADPSEPPTDLSFDPATEKTNGEPVDDFQQ